jgi:3-oxoadipate enol-lactonase
MAIIGGANLYYEDRGPRDAAAVLLLHALGASASIWESQLEHLSRHHRVLAYDMRGHGASELKQTGDESTLPYSIADLAADAISVLDAAQVQSAVWIGISIGGMSALWAASHWSERVTALIVSNSSPGPAPREIWQARIDTVRATGMAPLVEPTLERWFTPEFRTREPIIVDRIRQTLKRCHPAAYAACCAAIRDQDQRSTLPNIVAPTMIIAGSADAATPPALSEAMCNAIAGSELHMLEAAHLSNVERADEFNALLVAFMAQHAD